MVAGAGPAGSRLAERLAQAGIEVTLVERLLTPNQNAFSSAALPINSIAENLIPSESISTYWNGWQILGPDSTKYQWTSSNNLGVVLDFGKLREILWSKALDSGVEFLLGWTVKSVKTLSGFAEVELFGPNGASQKRKVKWVVDATGQSRSLINSKYESKPIGKDNIFRGSGIEWILQGDSQSSNHWGKQLTFFLGTRWISHGYGWIFPMSNDQLKVGVCRLPPNSTKPLFNNQIALNQLLKSQGLNNFKIIDRHGGMVASSIKRAEPHIFGRIIGVGDAVSTANLLGGEGIRFALLSAETLAPLLTEDLLSINQNIYNANSPLKNYKKILSKKLGWRWIVSNRLGKKTWWGLSGSKADERLLKLIKGLSEKVSAEEISALLFDYRFERYGIRILPYLFGLRG